MLGPFVRFLDPGNSFFHTFPQFFRIPPLQETLSLRQLEPHCVNPATSIRIANKLHLTGINSYTTIAFDSSSPFSPSPRRPTALRSSASLWTRCSLC
jgi:hypothetical protein